MECEAANDADRKARLRKAPKQWADLVEQVEQLDGTKPAAEPPPRRVWSQIDQVDAVSKIPAKIMDVFLIRQSNNS
jgi:hypothetical protein